MNKTFSQISSDLRVTQITFKLINSTSANPKQGIMILAKFLVNIKRDNRGLIDENISSSTSSQ